MVKMPQDIALDQQVRGAAISEEIHIKLCF